MLDNALNKAVPYQDTQSEGDQRNCQQRFFSMKYIANIVST